jgi:hypothetical protein
MPNPEPKLHQLLAFGVILLLLSALQTYTGKALGRARLVERTNEPILFWLLVAINYAVGLWVIGVFIHFAP